MSFLITVADNANGTATATISGSVGNTIQVRYWNAADIEGSYGIGGARTGDGTVLLSLGKGAFLFLATEIVGFTPLAISNLTLQRITDVSDPLLSPDQTVAQSVVETLNAHIFSQSFTARRGYIPGFTLEQLATLQVTVICRNSQRELNDRDGSKPTFVVEIGVQKKVEIQEDEDVQTYLENQQAACDPYVLLCNEIVTHLAEKANWQQGPAHWIADDNNPLYSYPDLMSRMAFNGLLQITYIQNDD